MIINFNTKILFIFILALPVFGCASPTTPRPVTDYDLCVAKGGKMLKTFPPRCVDLTGEHIAQEISPSKPAPSNGGLGCNNQCGDGTCQQIVCTAVGCPCPETAKNCPKDCVASEF